VSNFIPDPIAITEQSVPYFEDSRDREIPGRGTEKSHARLQGEIIDFLARLGASSIYFVPGIYPGADRARRYGFQIFFMFSGRQGRIDCAALPIRSETPTKKDRALAQALYLVRLELEAACNSLMYKPGAVPLAPYMIGDGGKTVTEYLFDVQMQPHLLEARP